MDAPDLRMGASIPPDQEPTTPETARKRSRIRFSCTTCREKKLKCNRELPCDQCLKRAIAATCEYVPYSRLSHLRGEDEHLSRLHIGSGSGSGSGSGPPPLGLPPSPRATQAGGDSTLQTRLRHLEHLVQVLKSQRRSGDSRERDGKDARDVGDARDSSTISVTDAESEAHPPPPASQESYSNNATAGPIVGESRYVDAANWEAILDDIAQLTDDLKTFGDEGESPHGGNTLEADTQPAEHEGPMLLLGSWPRASVAEILTYLPPRLTTDRVIARFFQGKEPAWMMFHVPTFLRQYEEFWKNSEGASLSWLALLFMMVSHAALFCLRGDEEVPGNLGEPLQVADTYRIRAAQCLALDDYTKPGEFKVEALILYFGSEYLRQADARLGTSIVLTMIIRLAMHMGLHRDPKHFKELSPFQGEMRRRLWTLLTEIDQLVAFQFGLPGNINPRHYDTMAPRNLLDEDFDEDSTELPPSRAETERTPSLYTIVKSRIMNVFREIVTTITSPQPTRYATVMALDRSLEEAHDAFPSTLRMRTFSQSITDPTDLIMQRYWLDLLYQKARSVLHRKYMGVGRADARFAHSRWACIDAATRTLRHQYDVHVEIQSGGRLSKERWFVSSLSTHDFLLADMILCLELSYSMRCPQTPTTSVTPGQSEQESPVPAASAPLHTNTNPPPANRPDRPDRPNRPDRSDRPTVIPKEKLLEILRTSRDIWRTGRHQSAEANRAFKILSRMLTVSAGAEFESSPESSGSGAMEISGILQRPAPPAEYRSLLGTGPSFGYLGPGWLGGIAADTRKASSTPSWTSSAAFNPTRASGVSSQSVLSLLDHNMGVGLDGLEGMLDPNMTVDWTQWDNQVQNASADMLQIPWSAFFQPQQGSTQ